MSTTIRTEVRLGSFTDELELDRNPWDVIGDTIKGLAYQSWSGTVVTPGSTEQLRPLGFFGTATQSNIRVDFTAGTYRGMQSAAGAIPMPGDTMLNAGTWVYSTVAIPTCRLVVGNLQTGQYPVVRQVAVQPNTWTQLLAPGQALPAIPAGAQLWVDTGGAAVAAGTMWVEQPSLLRLVGGDASQVTQPLSPADPDRPVWSASAMAAGLRRVLTGLPAGSTIYLAVNAGWDPGFMSFGSGQRLPHIEVNGERYSVPTINPGSFVAAQEPAAQMLLPITIPASGQLDVRLMGDELDGNHSTRSGEVSFHGLRFLYGDVWQHISDGRYPDPDPTAGAWVLDGYRHSWEIDSWPSQPAPATAALSLAAVDPSLFPPMEIGTRASVVVKALTQTADTALQITELARFEGRISDAVAGPILLPVDVAGEIEEVAALGVTLTLVDLTADAAEAWIAAQPWPEEYPGPRVSRIFTQAKLPTFSDPGAALDVFDSFRPLDVDHRTAADVLEEHLSQLTRVGNLYDPTNEGWQRPILTYEVVGWTGRLMEWPLSLPGAHGFYLATLDERNHYGGPLKLTRVGDELQAQLAADVSTDGQGHGTIPSSHVDVDVTWRRDKGRATNRATVGGDFAGLYGELGPDLTYRTTQVEAEWPDLVKRYGKVTASKDSGLVYYHSAVLLAQMLRGDRAEATGKWAVEAATIYVTELPDHIAVKQVAGNLFPVLFQELWGNSSPWGNPKVITGLQQAHQLEGVPYMGGHLIGAQLAVARGRAAITAMLKPGIGRQVSEQPYNWPTESVPDSNGYAMTYAHLAMRHPGATYKETAPGAPFVDPELTYYQMRLVRSE